MVDNVKYLNAEQTMMKVEPEGWNVSVNSNTWHQERIEQWQEGRTDAWDAEKEAYDQYRAIMDYDGLLAQYETDKAQCTADFEACGLGEFAANCQSDYGSCMLALRAPREPKGYNTQEQVDNSVFIHDDWVLTKSEWKDVYDDEFPIEEPVILLLPANLPATPEPAVLIPNTIEDYVKPVNEVRSEKLAELSVKFNAAANTDVDTAHGVFSGGSKGALERKGVADLIEHRGRPLGIIHDVTHNPIELNINQLKDVSADIAEAYGAAVVNHEAKLKEVGNCGDNSACIIAIVW